MSLFASPESRHARTSRSRAVRMSPELLSVGFSARSDRARVFTPRLQEISRPNRTLLVSPPLPRRRARGGDLTCRSRHCRAALLVGARRVDEIFVALPVGITFALRQS